MATLLPAQAWAAPPGDPRNGPALVQLPQEKPVAPDEDKIEELSSWAGAPVEPPAEYNPDNVAPPQAAEDTVELDGAGDELVQVEGMPVRIGQASPTETMPNPPAPGGSWDVAMEPRASTESAEVDGALIKVTPPPAGSTPVDVELDYGHFEDLFGTEWSSRLKLTQLPSCFLETPELDECATAVDIPSANNPGTETIRATVDPAAGPAQGLTAQAGGGPIVLAATDSAAGAGGTYKATPLSATGSWTAGGSGGGFSWSYPLTIPAPPAGPAPKIAFSYSSQAVDGKTSVANGQASWIGDGWDYNPGFIERRYRSCPDDRKEFPEDVKNDNVPNNDNTTDKKKSDLCWASDHLVMSLGGNSTELVHDPDGTWVPANDDGAKVEYKDKNGVTRPDQTGAYDGEHWVVTLRDGTRYWFGRNDVDGSGSRPLTDSVFTVPVFGNHAGEPCHAATYANSSCNQAWRWSLDYVEDVHGNAMIIDWAKETARYAKNSKYKAAQPYTRGGYPTQILYGLRAGNLNGTPAGKVLFKVDERCLKEGSVACSDAEFESANYEEKQPWWDTPSTLHCKATAKNCYVSSPTFWTRKRLTEVTTYGQRTPGSTSLSLVDRWNLQQSFPKQRTDTHPPLWLESITRTGFGTTLDEDGHQTSTPVPAVSFLPNVVDMPNRVAKGASDTTPDYDRLRVETIRTETGGEIYVDYSDPCPLSATHPTPKDNTDRCFPVHWSPDPDLEEPPLEWFNKYVVDQVLEKDRVARQPDVVTTYTYEGGAEWAKDTDEFSKPELRTFSQWRGYASVLAKKGRPATSGDLSEQSQTRTRYFRGMSGDAGGASLTIKDSTGTEELGDDLPPYQGQVAETITYTKAGGTIASRQLNWPYSKVTATRPRPEAKLPVLNAYWTGTRRTDTSQTISSGKERWTSSSTTFDPTYGLPQTTENHTLTPNAQGGDTTGDQACATTSYVHNPSIHLIGLAHRVRTTAGDCQAAPAAGGDKVISDVRTSYDALNAFGGTPTKGLAYQVDTVGGDGTSWVTSTRNEYDALGRTVKVTDASGNPTRTSFTPSTGPAFTTTVINAAEHSSSTVSDPGRGSVLSVTDPNGRKATSRYDDLGRITAVWSPSRTPVTHAPNATFDYRVDSDETPAVITRSLRDNGTYEDSVVLYDGLLRPRQTQNEALGGGRLIVDTLYDDNGTVWQTHNSYYAKGEPDPAGLFVAKSLTEVKNSTQTRYDGLGRPLRTTTLYEGDPQHSATNQYGGDWTLTRSGMSADGLTPRSGSRAAKTWTDTVGRTSLIQHYSAADLTVPINTHYAYDPRGNLTKVTDEHGNTWESTYDARKRLTASKDPDAGTASFGYNALDQQTWSKDAADRLQYKTYDVLGRQTELRDDTASGLLVAKWTYDTLPGGKGHPVASTRYNNGAAYTSEITGYDTEYRPTGTKITIPATTATQGLAGTYAYTNTYTPTGQPQSVQLPATPGGLAAEKIITRYNGEGAPVTTSGLAWYTADTRYSPFGEILRTVSGEAPRRVWTTNLYNDNTGRVDQSVADRETANPNRISALTYGYDTVGNVTSITDTQTTGTDRQCFAYDPMGRMAHAWTGATDCNASSAAQGAGPARSQVTAGTAGDGYWQEYEFDAIGNRTKLKVHDPNNAALDDTHTYTYGRTVTGNGMQPATTVQPHTLTQADSTEVTATGQVTNRSTYAYDIAGNTTERVIGGDTQSLTWDRRNKLTAADTDNNGTANVTYLYDANGNRLLEDNGTTRTLFLGEAEVTVNTAGQATDAKRYYTHPGGPTTVRATGGKTTNHKLTVLLSDHHNTATSAVEQTAGQALTRRKFDPYGNPRGTEPTNWPDRRTFLGTGIDDPLTGLTHIGAREYDPTLGRFISIDPIIDITDPLQMNGYTYANASPVTGSDPTGLFCDGCSANEDNSAWDPSHGPGCTTEGCPDSPPPSKGGNSSGGKGDGNGTSVDIKKEGNSVKLAGRYIPTQEELLRRGHSPWNDYQRNVEQWAQRICQNFEENKKFCNAADSVGWLGETGDILEVLGIRDAIECVQGDAGSCVWVAVDVAVSVATLGLGKAGTAAARAAKAGAKEADDAGGLLIACLRADSFVAGTRVQLADGTTKAIEGIHTGDTVLATDPQTGETKPQPVTAVILTKDDKEYVELRVETAEGIRAITATGHHPFWSESENAWINAAELTPGMTLRSDDGASVKLRGSRTYIDHQVTYNLTVAGLHTYYVLAGKMPVLVHNCNGWDPVNGGLDDNTYDRVDNVHGPDVADGVDYQVRRMHDGSSTALDHDLPGIGHDPDALGSYFASWRGKMTHTDTKTGSRVAYDSSRGVLIVTTGRNIHGYRYSQGAFNSGRYVTP
ncbi:polymorphic toxin-type HINT domain-containing protein [Streptomyces sp. AM8-1-1]|uniref:polymorphic toxin-type HINT domain-containing protein n=1 Tax=Streptomyces sp. AM8-1-1 TaxID=3075825 RepID=UPI0028C3D88E|nr:polymorphic toxin-type HINT domain-containing protein [Streptomyces sp. AM8-1-1]WNO76950.1 polymorphic toxin-type HINT domain-containing protein [Streptomyces sp. AM8-1-1]